MKQNLTIVSKNFLEQINEKKEKILSLLNDGKPLSQNDFIQEVTLKLVKCFGECRKK